MAEPRIVLFDLEVLPDLNEARKVWFGLSNYPGLTLRAQISSIICFGYKEFGKHNKADVICAWNYPEWKRDVNNDYRLVKDARAILAGADALVGHNIKKFDWKFFQTRLIRHGLAPLPNLPLIDTRQEASRNLFLFNNKLDNVGRFLLNDKKLEHEGQDLWVAVADRDKDAQKRMAAYCKQDVLLLEKAYRLLRPFMRNIPNHNAFVPGLQQLCPACGSTRLHRAGYKRTKTRTYCQYRCQDCGSWCNTDAADRNPR